MSNDTLRQIAHTVYPEFKWIGHTLRKNNGILKETLDQNPLRRSVEFAHQKQCDERPRQRSLANKKRCGTSMFHPLSHTGVNNSKLRSELSQFLVRSDQTWHKRSKILNILTSNILTSNTKRQFVAFKVLAGYTVVGENGILHRTKAKVTRTSSMIE